MEQWWIFVSFAIIPYSFRLLLSFKRDTIWIDKNNVILVKRCFFFRMLFIKISESLILIYNFVYYCSNKCYKTSLAQNICLSEVTSLVDWLLLVPLVSKILSFYTFLPIRKLVIFVLELLFLYAPLRYLQSKRTLVFQIILSFCQQYIKYFTSKLKSKRSVTPKIRS